MGLYSVFSHDAVPNVVIVCSAGKSLEADVWVGTSTRVVASKSVEQEDEERREGEFLISAIS